jgi:phosphatidylserine decarboxylase
MQTPDSIPIRYFNRYTQQLETEQVYGERWLRWAYETPVGRLSTRLMFKRVWFSVWYGWRMDKNKSKKRVVPFIQRYGVDAGEFLESPESYRTFNDFFYRRLKGSVRPIDLQAGVVVFPADGRHLGFQDLSRTAQVFVKGQSFDLLSLFGGDTDLAHRYREGSLVLSRLCPTDYHRFHFPAEGVPGVAHKIRGKLYSVNPIALRQNLSIFWSNRRQYTKIQTAHLGLVTMMEVGATCVGHIVQTYKPGAPCTRGQEKGYFKFGGSAVLLFFEKGAVQLSADLLEQTARGYELYARMGDALGLATPARGPTSIHAPGEDKA